MTATQPHSPVAMDRDQVWQVLDAQRISQAGLLEQLSEDEWQRPSLCADWTVRDVAAHLTLQQLGPGAAIAMMLRWRGSIWAKIGGAARRRAAVLSTGQIIAEIRGMAGSRRHNFGSTYLEPFTDILVHAQDIAIPLGRRFAMPPEAAAIAASRALSMRWPPPLPSVRKVARFRLTATDVPWSAGEGPEVRGPMAAILLVCTGRPAALPQLSGPGVPGLTARLSAPARS
jgi:uncharacterized protein (TIGR03083 family)